MKTLPYTPAMGITQSILQNFLACRYRERLSLDGWEPKRQKASFRFGSLIHDTLEFYYNGIRAGTFVKARLAETLKAIVSKIGQTTTLNLTRANPGEPDEIEAEQSIAEALMEGYLRHWGEDWARDWVGVEGEFDFVWRGFRLRGKRDAVFREPSPRKGGTPGAPTTPGLWLLETKTKSQIDEDSLDLSLAFDFQSLFYILALENDPSYPGSWGSPRAPVKGCLYNILRKPGLRPYEANAKRAKAETRAEFLARIAEDIRAKPEHYFKRFEISFPTAVRAEFEEQLAAQLGEFTAWHAGNLPTYRNTNSCITKYKCEFLEHCAAGNFHGYAKTRLPFPELAATVGTTGNTTAEQKGETHGGTKNPGPEPTESNQTESREAPGGGRATPGNARATPRTESRGTRPPKVRPSPLRAGKNR